MIFMSLIEIANEFYESSSKPQYCDVIYRFNLIPDNIS